MDDYFPAFVQHMPILSAKLDSNAISTMLVIVVTFMIRSLVLLWLEKHTEIPQENIARWNQRIRYIVFLFIIISLLVIWAPELRAFAVSIVAVSAAIVIGLKEIINNVIGGFIRSSVEGSRLGGRVTINNVRGDVVANNILSTSLLEVNDNGLRTGRLVVIPNSFFMTNAAVTEFFMDRKYMLMWVEIPMNREEDWTRIETALLEIGKKISTPYMRDAVNYFERFNRKFGLNIPSAEPGVFIEWPETGKIALKLRVAVPVNEQSSKRQDVLRHILGLQQQQPNASKGAGEAQDAAAL